MCQQTKRLVVERKTEDIYGNRIWFCTIIHGKSSESQEYVFTKETFNFKRWIVLMSVFSALAFYCEFYTVNASFLALFLCFLCLVLILKLHLKVKQESLLVIASLGFQLTTTFVTGRKDSQFILREDIMDVVINEGIFMNRVLFYLAVLLKDMEDPLKIKGILPLFKYTFPRLDSLELIYNGIQTAFHMHQKEHKE